jgi:predicted metalloprotease
MRLEGRPESDNIEDRRGRRSGVGLPLGGGIGGIILILAISALTGTNPLDLLNFVGTPGEEQTEPTSSATDTQARAISVVLRNTEDTWRRVLLQQGGEAYVPPTLVLFTDATETACGTGQAAMGPFYCPGDQKVYLDLGFFRELDEKYGAPGDFAQAYVIAHEVGHHVQTMLGQTARLAKLREGISERAWNAVSVRQELQADCFAGIWASSASHDGLLETGDVEEGLRAAAAVGDDTLQRRAQGRVVPESFTHGTSADRVKWFREGLETGRVDACNTFALAD